MGLITTRVRRNQQGRGRPAIEAIRRCAQKRVRRVSLACFSIKGKKEGKIQKGEGAKKA